MAVALDSRHEFRKWVVSLGFGLLKKSALLKIIISMSKKVLIVIFVLVLSFIAIGDSRRIAAKAAGGEFDSAYRRLITFDLSTISRSGLPNFPLWVVLRDPLLRSRSHGGHVSRHDGRDIFFTLADGKTVLPAEIAAYSPEKGEVDAWVMVPTLAAQKGGEIFVHYGGRELTSGSQIWSDEYALVKYFGDLTDPDLEIPRSADLGVKKALTVEAWVYAAESRAEALQPLVSKWAPRESLTPEAFSAYDAGRTDGLDCFMYYGAVFDGRYVYFCPIRSKKFDRMSVHAHVLRYDTHKNFYSPASWEAYDAGKTDGLHTVCYYGAVFDGRYVVFVPRDEGSGYHSRVLRYDTTKAFKSPASWEAYDAGLPHSHQSAAFDGRYIYFCPGYDGTTSKNPLSLGEGEGSGKVLRLDTRGDFKSPASYAVFDSKAVSPEAVCFDGAAYDGRYVYFAPLQNGVVLRYDTQAPFEDPRSWQCFDGRPLGMKPCVGIVFDGRHLYFVAYGHSLMIRYDSRLEFTDPSSWESYDAAHTNGLDTGGFDGGFFDGRYIVFVPWIRTVKEGEKKNRVHGNFLRYDTQGRFSDPKSWDAYDASHTDGLTSRGYNAGAFDGRFFYGAPMHDGESDDLHGRVLRYDSTGSNATFSLRFCDYGHNGGLNAAVPGPSFLLNTKNGALSVAAHRVIVPGWHYLAGTYDGASIRLYIDGQLAAERAGSGDLVENKINVEIGRLGKGAARFRGIVRQVLVSRTARSADWVRARYRNISDPSGFIRLGPEETVR